MRSSRRSWAHPLLICSLDRSPVTELTRVGLVVGRRIGNAVTRNRVKRRLREVVRSLFPRLQPGYDVVFIARPAAASASPQELEAAVVSLLQRAGVLVDGGAAAPDQRGTRPEEAQA